PAPLFTRSLHDALPIFRDPLGIRPLVLGKLADGFVLASESCALSTMGAEFVRDVLPGEMLVIGPDGLNSYYYGGHGAESLCIFEDRKSTRLNSSHVKIS